MKKTVIGLGFSLLASGAALGQSPVGEWLVEDGTAHIRIVSCGGPLWGVIAWTKDTPGKDENNPDPAKRSRSVMGMPILINMKQGKSQWDGEVYNAENGKTYTANISLKSADVLRIEGCVLGFLCGGEDWKRVASAKPAKSDQDVCSGIPK